MPTYKYVRDIANGAPEYIHFKKRVLYDNDTIEMNCYLSQKLLNMYGLQFVSDDPNINPIILTSGSLASGVTKSYDIPDINANFDIHINLSTSATATIWFNDDDDKGINIITGGHYVVARYLSGKSIRNITINVGGSGNACLYLMRVEQFVQTEEPGF